MKTRKIMAYGIIAVIIMLAFIACPMDEETSTKVTVGSISGRAVFTDSSTGNEGITITLESSNGLLSVSVVEANRSIAAGARSIVARQVTATARTAPDGRFTLNNIPAGTYILYASSQNSLEKAVTRNVTVIANQTSIAETLNLTPVGSISGKITVQTGTPMGFIVSAAGTSFMAMTDSNGNFTISGIPAQNSYTLIIMRGNYMGVYSSEPVHIAVGANPPLGTRNITNAELLENTFVTISEDGYWVINGVKTNIKAQGENGTTPRVGENGNWWIGTTDTGVKAQGPQGNTPHIGENGNWWIGTTDTGVKAQGENGTTPHVGENGNWWIGTTDTGVKAQGPQGDTGESGNTPYIGINGNWWIGTTDTGIKAQGPQGDPGDGFQPYTIIYRANGGDGEMANSVHLIGMAQNLHPNTFTRLGHAFAGWARTTSAGTVEFTDGQNVLNLADARGAEIDLYAVWSANAYIVVYDANGGSGTMAPSVFNVGTTNALRSNTFTSPAHAFAGWARTSGGAVEFTDQQNVCDLTTTVGGTVTLYAVWEAVIGNPVPGANLAEKLSWLTANAASDTDYTVEVTSALETIAPNNTLSYSGRTNISITLRGAGASPRLIGLNTNGTMFTVGSGVTLILDNNITLQGRGNNGSLIIVNSGAALVMNEGSLVTGNSSSNGGGVRINSGTFTMNGGAISGNTSSSSPYAYGGGVYLDGGTFTMNGGAISGNTSSVSGSGSGSYAYGGGVYVASGSFTMNGGAISGNTSASSASYQGSYAYGGGVYLGGGTFTMNGGAISGNTSINTSPYSFSYAYGGGVYVGSGVFEKSGGTIYGYAEGDDNSNAVRDRYTNTLNNQGHAIYASSGGVTKRKETTAGPEADLVFQHGLFLGDWDF